MLQGFLYYIMSSKECQFLSLLLLVLNILLIILLVLIF